MSFGLTIKVFIICQLERVLILLGIGEIPWLYHLLLRHFNEKKKRIKAVCD